MKINQKVIIGAVFYNESTKMDKLLKRFDQLKLQNPFKVIFVNDGSTDDTSSVLEEFIKIKKHSNFTLLSNKGNKGVGYTIRRIINYGLKQKADICVIMAGNGKDNPLEVGKIVSPITNGNFDYIQGSRFLEGGSFQNLPLVRKMLIKGFTFVMYLFTGFRSSDSTNGFRAYKLSLFKDKRININQSWLDRYELETYLHYKVLTLGYKVKEVPVSKDYLPGVAKYSKIRPIFDWWKMIRPIFLLKFGIKY
jgi:dolichol-phosphate mannosyltransferase